MRHAVVAIVVVALAGGAANADHAAAADRAWITISPIEATFDPAGRLTVYQVQRETHGTQMPVTVTWTLKLELVDKSGAPEPGTPNSGAAVDVGCSNAGVGVTEPDEHVVAVGHPTTKFIWHHPDPADSVPPGKYHCNHADMGPRGHQGLITVTVADKEWSCTATYKGTNTSTPQSETNGTASMPVCKQLKK